MPNAEHEMGLIRFVRSGGRIAWILIATVMS